MTYETVYDKECFGHSPLKFTKCRARSNFNDFFAETAATVETPYEKLARYDIDDLSDEHAGSHFTVFADHLRRSVNGVTLRSQHSYVSHPFTYV